MHNFLINLTAWITSHPHLAGMVIFVSSFAESLAFVGLVIPGAAIMLTTGALIANDALSFWPTMAWAVCGAVLGDGISYWFGRHFRGRIRSFPLFNRHPEMFDRVEEFFNRHGGKSVFFGRFIGPIRPIIPIVAGMLEMRPLHFTIYNVLSAVGWAPAYLLPGIAFDASLALAGEVAGRLAMLLVLLMGLAWLVFIVFQKIFFLILARYPVWERKAAYAITQAPEHTKVEAPLFLRPFIILTLLFISALWFFLGIAEDVVTGDPLVASGISLYHFFQGLRTPWGDALMTGITMLGDAAVTVPLVSILTIWLLWKKNGRASLFLGITTIGAFLFVTIIKAITKIPRPIAMYHGATHWAFPSSHATMSLVVFGFVAFLCSLELAGRRRWLPFALAIFSSLIIGFSRLYLGAHWLSDVLGGYSLGMAWLVVMAVTYLGSNKPAGQAGIFRFCLLLFPLIFTIHWLTGYTASRLRYQPHYTYTQMETDAWHKSNWRQLPLYRQDIEGEKEQLLNLQYAGSLPRLAARLQKNGWQKPLPLTIASSLRWLMAKPTYRDIPILPLVNDGRHDVFLMTYKPPNQTNRFLALRLWPTTRILDNSTPLWVGTISWMELRQYAALMTIAKNISVASAPKYLTEQPGELFWRKRSGTKQILLIHEAN